mgnify:FL=1
MNRSVTSEIEALEAMIRNHEDSIANLRRKVDALRRRNEA